MTPSYLGMHHPKAAFFSFRGVYLSRSLDRLQVWLVSNRVRVSIVTGWCQSLADLWSLTHLLALSTWFSPVVSSKALYIISDWRSTDKENSSSDWHFWAFTIDKCCYPLIRNSRDKIYSNVFITPSIGHANREHTSGWVWFSASTHHNFRCPWSAYNSYFHDIQITDCTSHTTFSLRCFSSLSALVGLSCSPGDESMLSGWHSFSSTHASGLFGPWQVMCFRQDSDTNLFMMPPCKEFTDFSSAQVSCCLEEDQRLLCTIALMASSTGVRPEIE